MTLTPILQADVYKAGQLAASLHLAADGSTYFTYLPHYFGAPIATTLPITLRELRSSNGSLPAFFTGLLPEGARLQRLAQQSKTSLDNELRLLLEVGNDVPGDVQIVPQGNPPAEMTALIHSNLENTLFSELFDAVDQRSLPGVQEKASAAMISFPTRIRKTNRHPRPDCPVDGIVKLNPPRYLGLVENEFIHLQAAQKLNIPVAQAELVHDSVGDRGLFVERFDRQCSGGTTLRLPCEDASQVLNIPPALKYEVSAESVVNALSEQCAASAVARRNLLMQFLFAWLTGNGDLHAKNVSILHNGIQWSIAPMYDIPCTLIYGDDEMALPVQGRKKKIKMHHWVDFAQEIHIPLNAMPRIVARTLKAAQSITWEDLPFTGSPLNATKRELASRHWQCERWLDEHHLMHRRQG